MQSPAHSCKRTDAPLIYMSDPLSEFFALPSFFNLILSQLYLPVYGAVNFCIYSPVAVPGYPIRTPH